MQTEMDLHDIRKAAIERDMIKDAEDRYGLFGPCFFCEHPITFSVIPTELHPEFVALCELCKTRIIPTLNFEDYDPGCVI
jgi:hypothetical protein